jgi:hypothetical protein
MHASQRLPMVEIANYLFKDDLGRNAIMRGRAQACM